MNPPTSRSRGSANRKLAFKHRKSLQLVSRCTYIEVIVFEKFSCSRGVDIARVIFPPAVNQNAQRSVAIKVGLLDGKQIAELELLRHDAVLASVQQDANVAVGVEGWCNLLGVLDWRAKSWSREIANLETFEQRIVLHSPHEIVITASAMKSFIFTSQKAKCVAIVRCGPPLYPQQSQSARDRSVIR